MDLKQQLKDMIAVFEQYYKVAKLNETASRLSEESYGACVPYMHSDRRPNEWNKNGGPSPLALI